MHVELLDLWVPIVVSAVIAFAASFVMWMVLPVHKKDVKMLPDEGPLMTAVSSMAPEPGLYMFPGCQGGETMKSDAFKARWKAGPWGTLNVVGGPPNFARNLAVTFIEMVVISFVVAYLGTLALPRDDEYMHVFRFVGTAAILGYVFGGFGCDTFMGRAPRFQFTSAIDSLIYALLTAGTFAWLWPAAETVVPIVTP